MREDRTSDARPREELVSPNGTTDHADSGLVDVETRAMRILLLATRDVGARTTGRIVVLRTHVDALSSLGHEVTVAVVSPTPPEDTTWSSRFRTVHVRAPRPASVARSAAKALLTRSATLNEALFVDRRVQREIAELVAAEHIDVVVVDSLRLSRATALVRPTLPTVVDLDDLLSVRYRRMSVDGVRDPAAVLGFAADRVPALLRGAVARLAVRLLGWEARRAEGRELALTCSSLVVSLVSRDEVRILRERTGRDIAWLPPATAVPARAVDRGDGLVFLGGLDYLPNLRALRLYRDDVLPHLDPDDPRQVLHVVGHAPDRVRAELDVPGIVVHGFADDLAGALSRSIMVAPLDDAGGIKLKVLEGMAHGLPVAGLPGAFEGLGLPADLRAQAKDGPHLAVVIRELLEDSDRCSALSRGGRAFVEADFSPAAAQKRWQAVLERLAIAG